VISKKGRGLALRSDRAPHNPIRSISTAQKECIAMFARIVGFTLGIILALGATAVVNPDGKVMDAVSSVTSGPKKGEASKR
jgi:hypothetical protein